MTVVAIDGPAGAGKSTVAKALADRMGFTYVDTGAMYRAVALAALGSGVAPRSGPALESLLAKIDIDVTHEGVLLDGVDVTVRIREPDVTSAVSSFSALPEVRARLVELQRALASGSNVVMEGRDIGTAVFPDAQVKVFLTASLGERARRRSLETDGNSGDLEAVQSAVAARDRADSDRDISPLVQAPDAVVVDTTSSSIDQVVDRLIAAVEGRNGRD